MITLKEALENIDLATLKLGDYQEMGILSGGMNNVNYLIKSHDVKYIVYLPTPKCNEIVNRKDEHFNLKEVNKLGISNTNIYHDEVSGIKINTYLEGKAVNEIKDIPYNDIASVMKKLHNSNVKLAASYNPFSRLIGYENSVKELKITIDERYYKIREKLFEKKDYLESQKLVPCHNDPQPSNFIYDGKNTYLIDFEFAAYNDYVYDLACFANVRLEEGLKLLEVYDGNKDNLERFYLWRIYQCLQWYNVALIKQYSGLSDYMHFDFNVVAKNYLELSLKLYKDYYKKEL